MSNVSFAFIMFVMLIATFYILHILFVPDVTATNVEVMRLIFDWENKTNAIAGLSYFLAILIFLEYCWSNYERRPQGKLGQK